MDRHFPYGLSPTFRTDVLCLFLIGQNHIPKIIPRIRAFSSIAEESQGIVRRQWTTKMRKPSRRVGSQIDGRAMHRSKASFARKRKQRFPFERMLTNQGTESGMQSNPVFKRSDIIGSLSSTSSAQACTTGLKPALVKKSYLKIRKAGVYPRLALNPISKKISVGVVPTTEWCHCNRLEAQTPNKAPGNKAVVCRVSVSHKGHVCGDNAPVFASDRLLKYFDIS